MAVGQGDLLQAQHEVVAGARVEHVHRPGHGAVGAGLGLLQAEHGVEHRASGLRPRRARRAARRASAPPARRPRPRLACASFAVRRERHVEGVVARGLGQHVELQLAARPGRSRACPSTASWPARRGRAAARCRSPRPRTACGLPFSTWPTNSAKCAVRVLDHVGPGRIALRQLGPSRPAQAGEHRLRARLDLDAAVDVVADEVLRRLRRLVDATAPSPAPCSGGRWRGPSARTSRPRCRDP